MTQPTGNLTEQVALLIEDLNKTEIAAHAKNGYTFAADVWAAKEKSKYINLDCGTSGAFLVEKSTGDIFRIKAYGVINRKKRVGSAFLIDGARLWKLRYC